MTRRSTIIFILCAVWSLTAVCQSTTVGLKIGNNGNISFTNKFKNGNSTEKYNFGNGYQGGVYLQKRICRGLGLRGEFTYVNSSFEMDHESKWMTELPQEGNRFYEEIVVNTSAFNFSGNVVLNLGRVKLGVGPEVSLITQANGRGRRHHFEDAAFEGQPQQVQYRFFANRQQVYNLDDREEKFAYDANRILYGLDVNLNVVVYKPFSIQAKVFYPMNDFIEEFMGFENMKVNQQTINAQISVVYEFPMILGQGYLPVKKKKKRR